MDKNKFNVNPAVCLCFGINIMMILNVIENRKYLYSSNLYTSIVLIRSFKHKTYTGKTNANTFYVVFNKEENV